MAEKLTKIEKLSFIPEEFDIPNYLHITEAINQARVNGFKFTSCKKNKSEVAGTGRKLFRQKGTGNARQGERRNPHRHGGGQAFPAKPRFRPISINKQVAISALVSTLLHHAQDGSLHTVADTVLAGFKKTREVVDFIYGNNLPSSVVIVDLPESEIFRTSRNLPDVLAITPGRVSASLLSKFHDVIFSETAFNILVESLSFDDGVEEAEAAESVSIEASSEELSEKPKRTRKAKNSEPEVTENE